MIKQSPSKFSVINCNKTAVALPGVLLQSITSQLDRVHLVGRHEVFIKLNNRNWGMSVRNLLCARLVDRGQIQISQWTSQKFWIAVRVISAAPQKAFSDLSKIWSPLQHLTME